MEDGFEFPVIKHNFSTYKVKTYINTFVTLCEGKQCLGTYFRVSHTKNRSQYVCFCFLDFSLSVVPSFKKYICIFFISALAVPLVLHLLPPIVLCLDPKLVVIHES